MQDPRRPISESSDDSRRLPGGLLLPLLLVTAVLLVLTFWILHQAQTEAQFQSSSDLFSVYKSATETVSGSDVLQPDDHLAIPLDEGFSTYSFDLFLRHNSSAAADLKIQWDVESGTTLSWAPSTTEVNEFTETTTRTMGGSGNNRVALFQGVVFTGSVTGSEARLEWAQNTSEASDTSVLEGSYILWKKVN